MSCGKPHETDCSEILDHLYEYLDNEMAKGDYAKFRMHFDECHPCLEKYGLEVAVKQLVKRCCGAEEAPADLRGKVMDRIEAIRVGQASSQPPVHGDTTGAVLDAGASDGVDEASAGAAGLSGGEVGSTAAGATASAPRTGARPGPNDG